VSEEDVALVRRILELFIAGDRDQAWSWWAEDAVGIPPRDWPEVGELQGREAIRRQFEGWNAVFGPEWTRSMRIESARDLGEGRVLVELGFETAGLESGVPLNEELASIYTVRDGIVVRGEFFMSWGEARAAAGVA
jgi:ketosteroid isomerase-like protein